MRKRRCTGKVKPEIRKEQEALLKHGQDLYNCLAIISPEAITVTGTDFKIIMANQQAATLFGFVHVDAMIGYNALRLVVSPDVRRIIRDAEKTLKQGTMRGLEYYLRRKDGSNFIAEASMSLVLDDEGHPAAFVHVMRDITERKQNERLLRTSEEQYRSLIENINAGIYRSTIDRKGYGGNFIHANKAMAHMFGYRSVKELLRISVTDLYFKPEDRRVFTNAILKNGYVKSQESTLCKKDGTPVYVRCTARAHRDTEGRIQWIDGVVEDVTNERMTQEALRVSEDRFQQLAKNAQVCIWEVDATGLYTYASPIVKEILGYSPSELVGKKHYYDLVHPDDRERIKQSAGAIFASHKPFRSFLNRNLHKDGRDVWLSTSGVPVFDRQGVLKGYQGADIDVTQRFISEQELQKSKEKYKNIVENIQEVIMITEPTGIISYLSPACKNVLGYDPQELEGKQPWIIHPEDLARVKNAHAKALQGVAGSSFEYRIRTKDGAIRWISHSWRPLIKEGKLKAVISAISDVTQQRKARLALFESETRMRTAIESLPFDFFVINKDGRYTMQNATCHEHWGSIVGKRPEDLKVDSDTLAIWQENNRRAFAGEVVKGEVSFTIKGKKHCFYNIISPILSAEGVVPSILGVNIDMSELKRAEMQRLESEAKYRSLVENSLEGICITKNNRIVFANKAMLDIFGCHSLDEFLGTSLSKYVIHDDKTKVRKRVQERKRHEFLAPTQHECKIIRKNGEIREVAITSCDIMLRGQRYIQSTILDVTLRKRAQRQSETLNKELIKSNRQLKRLVLVDSQTNLYNHRYFEDAIEREFHRAGRDNQALSIILIDLDYFKSINDVYGHQFGDHLIKQFARLIHRSIRRHDIAIRFGGQEFMIICPGSDRDAALHVARRLFDSVVAYNFGNKKNRVKLKISIAVASYPEDDVVKSMDLVEVAYKILNKIKQDGGGRIYSYLDLVRRRLREQDRQHTKEVVEVDRLKERIEKLTKRANEGIVESVFAFARAIEAKDSYTGKHTESTVRYATQIARELNLSLEDTEHIRQAAILHDLGKVGISEGILRKKSRLTEHEFKEIKQHPRIAADIIRPIHSLHGLIPAILHHHERWDGKGYPDGLAKEHIPIAARIIAVADVFHALTSNRSYRTAFPKEKAVEIIHENAGTQFDPQIVDLFIRALERSHEIKNNTTLQ